jgi:integrase
MLKTLNDLLQDYSDQKVCLSPGYQEQLGVVVRLFERFLGRPAKPSDLTGQTVRGWMRWMLSLPRSPRTVNGRVATLCSLWRYAAKKKLTRETPDEIPHIREPQNIPISYTDSEFGAMVAACSTRRKYGPVMRAMLLVLWDTGCRLSAVLKAKRSAFDSHNRTVRITEPKTGKEQVYSLSPSTVDALLALNPEDGSLLGWTHTQTTLRNQLEKIQEVLGIPRDRYHKFHAIRKTKYSAVYVKFGLPVASQHLGHSCDLSRNYLDTRRLLNGEIATHLPPPTAAG